jgi:acyl-CoA synthetase (AMP-forming)/AMP-acid ligase II
MDVLLSVFNRRDFEDRTALIFQGARFTYGEIAAEGRRVAAGLQSFGVKKGDRIALHLKNSPQLFASLLGCWSIGAVAIPIRHWQSAAMTVSWCNYLGVTQLLVEEALVEKVAPHLAELTSCRSIVSTALAPRSKAVQPWSALVDNDGRYQPVAVDEREPVIIIHTSGTTARPKAVMQSMRALRARALGQLEHLPFEPEDVVCVFADCTHGFGLHFLATPTLAVGAAVLLVPEFDPPAILREMATHGATATGAAPAYLRSLLEAARRVPEPHLPKLRFALSASDKLPESLPGEWQKLFTGPLLEGAGMTEACGAIFSNRPGDIGVGTIGRPFPGVDVRIVGPGGRDVPDGTTGELWCKGDFLFSGYWNDPDATRRVMVDGWFKTGDQAVRDNDGRYRIVGRTPFMIKRGGIFVSPFEVEGALAKHTAIADCIAAGMPSEKWRQEVEAFIVLIQTISVADLRAHAAAALGEPSRPVRFWSVDRIPKTALGKVARSEVAELRASATLLM